MPDPRTGGQRIAVVGCGVAGLTAAWLLARRHRVTLYERNRYAGGHTRTLEIPAGEDAGAAVDTGFIVMNHRNYPLFTKVLEQLGVALEDSSMTFSFWDEAGGYAYAGNSAGSLFPGIGHFFNRGHWRMIGGIRRFAKVGYADLQSGALSGLTLGDYLDSRGFNEAFKERYLYPMGAAIWSSPLRRMADFPAEPYLHFLENHGLLRLTNRPQWRFVKGGSRTYVRALLDSADLDVRLGDAPRGIRRTGSGAVVTGGAGETETYDHVIIGAHADEALALLEDPDDTERALLGAWRYQENEVVLHRDPSVLPRNRKLWASWNFTREPGSDSERPVSVTYYMNRLQNLRTAGDYFVTLNREQPLPDEAVIDRTTMTHPQYSFDSMRTQDRIRERNGSRGTWFCGSYLGYGFHEDAVRSAVDVARGFGIEL